MPVIFNILNSWIFGGGTYDKKWFLVMLYRPFLLVSAISSHYSQLIFGYLSNSTWTILFNPIQKMPKISQSEFGKDCKDICVSLRDTVQTHSRIQGRKMYLMALKHFYRLNK